MRLLSPHFSAWHFPLGTFDNFQLFTKVTEPVEVHFQLNYQERQDELGLNWDSFKYRNYDYVIGRFMSINPLAEKYAYNFTYAFQENKMGLGRELEGLELVIRDENTGAISKGPYDTNNNNITEVQINKEGWSEELPAVEITAHYNQDNNDQQNLNLTPKGMVDVQPQLQQYGNTIVKAIPINNTKVTEVMDYDKDGKVDSGVITTPTGTKIIRVGINNVNKLTTNQKIAKKGLQFTANQIFKLIFKAPSQIIQSTDANKYEDRLVFKRSLGLSPLASPHSVDSAIIVRTINGDVIMSMDIQSYIIDTIEIKPIKP